MPTQFPGPSHAQLTLKAIHLIRGGQPVLQDLNLAVTTTSRIGIVGENGRGKTSLLHIITGRLEPDAGTVLRHGSLTVAEQEMPADDDRTVGDAIAEAIAPSVAALAALENATSGLIDGAPGAEDQYSLALETAQRLDAWDAQRRVEIALEALVRTPIRPSDSTRYPWGNATASDWPASWVDTTTSYCSMSPRITWIVKPWTS